MICGNYPKIENGAFYIKENSEICSYKLFAKILSDYEFNLGDFINANGIKKKLIGKIYKEDKAYVFQKYSFITKCL